MRAAVATRKEARRLWWQRPSLRNGGCGPGVPVQRPGGADLSESVQALLRFFPEQQFLTPSRKPPDLSKRGFLDLYSGSFGVARAVARRTGCWVLTFELCRDASEDLLDAGCQARILELVTAGAFYCVGGGPVCSSMSRAIRPPVRSATHPAGIPECRLAMQEKVRRGNQHAQLCRRRPGTTRTSGSRTRPPLSFGSSLCGGSWWRTQRPLESFSCWISAVVGHPGASALGFTLRRPLTVSSSFATVLAPISA